MPLFTVNFSVEHSFDIILGFVGIFLVGAKHTIIITLYLIS